MLTVKRETTGEPAKIQATADRDRIAADGRDLSVIAVSVADAEGRVVPTASNQIRFEIEGPARLIGVGNGDPSCHEPDKPEFLTEGRRSAFNGLCMAIVQSLQSPGTSSVKGSSASLQSFSVKIEATAVSAEHLVA